MDAGSGSLSDMERAFPATVVTIPYPLVKIYREAFVSFIMATVMALGAEGFDLAVAAASGNFNPIFRICFHADSFYVMMDVIFYQAAVSHSLVTTFHQDALLGLGSADSGTIVSPGP